MKSILVVISFPMLLELLAGQSGTAASAAEVEFQRGILALDHLDPDVALPHLQKAVKLDPRMTKAHFSLALAAEARMGPEASPDRNMSSLAIQEFKRVLELEPSHPEASIMLANLLSQLDDLAEAERFYRQHLKLSQNGPEAACGVAAMEAKIAWRDLVREKNRVNLSIDAPLIGSPACQGVRERNLPRFEEGIALLTQALAMAPENVTLMGFLSLSYRGRAEVQCGDTLTYQADINTGLKWDREGKQILDKNELGHVFRFCPAPPPPMPTKNKQ